jgi:prepilin-type N-terminal cleavage/methylation domain-containing protein
MFNLHVSSKDRSYKHANNGFTIIETILVISIISVIMIIVFLGVPEAQKSVRDHYRKVYANRVMQATLEFYKNNKRYPACDDYFGVCTTAKSDAFRFMTNYLPEGRDPSTGESYSSTTVNAFTTGLCKAQVTPSGSTSYCYDDTPGPYISHASRPSVGQVIIAAMHQCCPCGADTIENVPRRSVPEVLSVLIGMERGGYYCVDNSSNH